MVEQERQRLSDFSVTVIRLKDQVARLIC
ncbi:hypothetical protein ACVBEH_32735 [Roseateles sp. GG27B]